MYARFVTNIKGKIRKVEINYTFFRIFDKILYLCFMQKLVTVQRKNGTIEEMPDCCGAVRSVQSAKRQRGKNVEDQLKTKIWN